MRRLVQPHEITLPLQWSLRENVPAANAHPASRLTPPLSPRSPHPPDTSLPPAARTAMRHPRAPAFRSRVRTTADISLNPRSVRIASDSRRSTLPPTPNIRELPAPATSAPHAKLPS